MVPEGGTARLRFVSSKRLVTCDRSIVLPVQIRGICAQEDQV